MQKNDIYGNRPQGGIFGMKYVFYRPEHNAKGN